MTDPEVARYATHTALSDPGVHRGLLDALPTAVPDLCAAVRGLVVHYVASGIDFPPHRRAEIDSRRVEAILDRVVDRDPAPLTVPRAEAERFVGCCRDFSLLTVAALRHQGVPARTRIGFAPYLDATFCHDHVVVEHWDADRGGWRRTDPQIDPARPLPRPADVQDLGTGPDSPFRTAAAVWRDHREGRLEPGVDAYGASPDGEVRGAWFVANYVLGELAHLTGHELLLWDAWGAMASGPLEEDGPGRRFRRDPDAELVDRVADVLLDPGTTASDLHALAQDPRLDPRTGVVTVSPSGAAGSVALA